MSSQALHASLLRPAVIHILRAAGFHATKPAVVDTLTDICANYLLLVASRTTAFANDRTITELEDLERNAHSMDDDSNLPLIPSIADVRNALASAALFNTGVSASEEAWTEVMRKPLSSFPLGARDKERQRRDREDTQDVREFVDWASGPAAREIRRIAGLLPDEATTAAIPDNPPIPVASIEGPKAKDDYLDTLKKKHGKSGDGARYQGTALGKPHVDLRSIKIEGGPASLGDWQASLRKRKRETRD